MQRIDVDGDGITVTLMTEPLVSVFGKEMRQGRTNVCPIPWPEVAWVSLAANEFEPAAERWIELTVCHTSGHALGVNDDAEGFTEAVSAVCRLSGIPVPDSQELDAAGQVTIWSAPEPA